MVNSTITKGFFGVRRFGLPRFSQRQCPHNAVKCCRMSGDRMPARGWHCETLPTKLQQESPTHHDLDINSGT